MATHAPITGAPTRAPSAQSQRRNSERRALSLRLSIEDEIEMHLQRVDQLIGHLDDADAPFADLEDDDPAGDPLDCGEEASDTGERLLPTLPLYGVDQSRGPINERDAKIAFKAAELGLVRSPRGGWRWRTESSVRHS